MTGTRKRLAGLAIAALLVLPLIGTASVSAAPSEEEVEAAQARVEQLGHELEVVIERWNDARYQLQQAKERLAETERLVREAEAEAETARALLESRAVEAYTGMGGQIDVLLEAEDLTEFSDRLQFMGAIAQSDADLAAAADAAGQRAEWAREQHADAVADAEGHVAAMQDERARIQEMLDEQEALARTLEQRYSEWQDYLAAQRAQAEAAAQAPSQPSAPVGGDGGGGGGGFTPPPNASGAAIAVAAARSVIGTPYVWGAASPGVGFDCSGLTSWAWAQAGVSIPHSASAQYGSLPRVSLSAVAPGDIIYYGNFGPHVALYVGGGQIVHARHPGPGGEVQADSMYGYDQPWGAVRPG
jgi:cell wall-associated NlpC family hydrolase